MSNQRLIGGPQWRWPGVNVHPVAATRAAEFHPMRLVIRLRSIITEDVSGICGGRAEVPHHIAGVTNDGSTSETAATLFSSFLISIFL